MLLSRLDGLDARFEEVSTLITDPAVISDRKRYVRLTKEYHDLEELLGVRRKYEKALSAIEESKMIISSESDEEMRQLARDEMEEATAQLPKFEERIKLLLIPADPDDAKNAIVEIRGGTGGDEAALFAGDLFRMYQKFAETRGWQLAVSSFTEGTAGGYKEIVFTLTGQDVYGVMKYESGVHRVQRVPATETQGRVHTSAATVAVLPEAEEFDVEIHEGEIKWDTFRSGGAGGQNVNKVETTVRAIHVPSGISVRCSDERSQAQNKSLARERLLLKIHAMDEERSNAAARDKWENHDSLERGNPIKTFSGKL